MKKNLEVKDLHVTFQMQNSQLHAVRGIDFFLTEGETVGIVGESGCGKSATAKALIRLHSSLNTRSSGEIWFDEENIAAFSERQMREVRGKGIGMIFQDSAASLNPAMTIGAQLTEGYYKRFIHASKAEARDAACQMLHRVGMPSPETTMASYSHTLSGGMRQRALIAMILICKPKILLADEPTTALDPINQRDILHLLRQQQKETGMSILFITHDMRLVADFCDRVMVMYGGRIVESASAKEIFHTPKHPYTVGLLHAIPKKGSFLTAIEGGPPNLSLSLPYCSFCSRCPDAMNICAKSTPPLFQIAESHWNACFKYDPRCPQ